MSAGTSARPEGASVERDGPWLRVAIVGRVTGEAIAAFAAGLEDAIASSAPYVVLFDRRAMTGPTKEGRAALERWGETIMPRVAATCAGWADVYDERRAASLRQAAASSAESEASAGYPHALFDDSATATSWLTELLDRRAVAPPAS